MMSEGFMIFICTAILVLVMSSVSCDRHVREAYLEGRCRGACFATGREYGAVEREEGSTATPERCWCASGGDKRELTAIPK